MINEWVRGGWVLGWALLLIFYFEPFVGCLGLGCCFWPLFLSALLLMLVFLVFFPFCSFSYG